MVNRSDGLKSAECEQVAEPWDSIVFIDVNRTLNTHQWTTVEIGLIVLI
jgi:hypothetical protein